MSIIYQSLSKLRTSASAKPELKTITGNRTGRRARKDRMFAPRVLLLAALVFSTGIGVSYGIYQIQFESEGAQADSSATWPPPLDSAQSISTTTTDDESAGSFDAPAGKSAAILSTTKEPSSEIVTPNGGPTSDKYASKPTAEAAKPAGTASGATVAGIAKETPHISVVRQKTDQGTTQPAAADMEQIRRANMRRSLDISRLIADIQQSMGVADHRRTQRLLEELAGVKGHNDPFVMKLRSYWYTRQGNLNRAAAILQEVLQRKPNDLEAGLNMAIIEIKTGQIRRADERLVRLRELYPEDTRIPELMEKLQS